MVNPTPLDGHRRIPIITDEETQDENITEGDIQESLPSPQTSVPETPVATGTGATPEKQSTWFHLVAAILILMTGLGAAYILRKRM